MGASNLRDSNFVLPPSSTTFNCPTLSLPPTSLSPYVILDNKCLLLHPNRSHSLTRNDFTVPKALDLPVQDATASAQCFQELILFFIDNVLHHVWVLLQLRKGISLQTQEEEEKTFNMEICTSQQKKSSADTEE